MSKHTHRRNNSSFPTAPISEDIEGQLDRLNQALQVVMQEIELGTHSSRVPSSLSMVNSEYLKETDPESPSFQSEDYQLPKDFEERVEELLQTIDRDEMVIEDYRSNEFRRTSSSDSLPQNDINQLKIEIELQLRMQKNAALEKEKKNFEEKLEQLDTLKEDYIRKRKDILMGMEKLNTKEKLLEQKEKELRASRMAFDRHRFLWEQDHGQCDLKENIGTIEAKPNLDHRRNISAMNPLRSSLPLCGTFKSVLAEKINEPKPETVPFFKSSSLEEYQEELKNLESQLAKSFFTEGSDVSALELKIDSVKNKIAALRGEKVMMESAQATKLMSNIMISMQKQSNKDDTIVKRTQLLQRMNNKLPVVTNIVSNTPKNTEKFSEVFKLKQLEQKVPETSEKMRRFLFSDAPTPRGIHTPRTIEKEDPYKAYFENKKKVLAEKEKELSQREFLLQETWMKLPGAKELIDNVNLTLGRLNTEKNSLECAKDEFERERLEFIRMKEKFVMQMKRDEKKIVV